MELTVQDVYESLDGYQKDALYYLVGYALNTGRNYIPGNGDMDNAKQKELRRIFNNMNDDQQKLVRVLIDQAIDTYKQNKKGGTK